ncbi:MAG: SpoIIE family protein phosphatase [Planctomycetota bacterium]|jgi:serine phosphatase RsbU (regulator of sigma subunit)
MLDGEAGTLTSFSAGQGPLLRYDAGRQDFEALDADTLPLGITSEVEIEGPPPIRMQRGDLFVVLSDGFYEAVATDGAQFGVDRVMFTGGASPSDDRTAILVKRF